MGKHIALLVLAAAVPGVCLSQELADVEGRVIDAATKQPIAGARVVSLRMSPGAAYSGSIFEAEAKPTPQPSDSETFVNITGDDGRFSFKTTAPAQFRIFVRRQGYVNAGMSFDTVKRIEVKPGETLGGMEIVMAAEGGIRGRIVDAESGAPVKGLSVTPMQWRESGGTRALLPVGDGGKTDANGEYEIKGLRPGEFTLEAAPEIREKFLPSVDDDAFRNLVSTGYTRSFYPGVERQEDAVILTLVSGGTLGGTDFKVRKRKAAAIRGRIFADADVEALGDVMVSLSYLEVQGDTRSYQILAHDKLRVGDGFMLESLSPGSYSLSAVARSDTPKERRYADANFRIEDRNLDQVDLHLWRGATVRGRVVAGDGMRTQIEKPLMVGLSAQGRSARMSERPVNAPMPEGAFTLEGVAESAFKPFVSGLPKSLVVARVLYNGAEAERGVFTLNRGALEHKLALILAPATASVTANVRDGGRAVKGAQVVLVPEKHNPGQPQFDAKTIESDAEGRGTISNLSAGKYKLLAFPADARWRMGDMLTRNLGGARELTLAEGAVETVEAKLITQP